MNRKNPFLTTSITALLVLGLAGCSAGVPDAQGQPDPIAPSDAPLPEVSTEGYEGISAQLDFAHAAVTLPLDPYYAGSPSYVVAVLHAIAVRTDECMAGKGFPAIAGDTDWSPYLAEDRTFGLWSVDYASRYGVDLATEGQPVQFYDTAGYGADYAEAHPVCMEEAKQSLTEPLTALDAQAMTGLDVQIRGTAISLARASDNGMVALDDWQTCMEDRGVILDPDGRPAEQYKAQRREALVEAIMIEAECAASTHAVQRLYDLQARYEAAFVDAMADELTELKDQRDAIRDELEDAIARG